MPYRVSSVLRYVPVSVSVSLAVAITASIHKLRLQGSSLKSKWRGMLCPMVTLSCEVSCSLIVTASVGHQVQPTVEAYQIVIVTEPKIV
jgi:hypothetical protein